MPGTVSEILDEALRRSGLTARELSRRTGIAEGRISDYRSGRHEPGAARLIQLVEATGLGVQLRPVLDRNGLVLGELFDLADSLAVGSPATHEERIPSGCSTKSRLGKEAAGC
jgi:transcriptional regulator with XRE-family HTH domain